MRIYICIDDTDDLTKSTSTGKISELIMNAIVHMGGIIQYGITRHQLLLHEDIDYTSHNSSMCFAADIEGVTISEIQAAAEEILTANAAASADPGLCICELGELKHPDMLIAYGKRAQREVITKAEAYRLAEDIGGTVLREYGGTGMGVIGALAGVGLRLSGCDGTFRGGKEDGLIGITETAGRWKELAKVEKVVDMTGAELSGDQLVTNTKKIKTVFLDHKPTLVVRRKGDGYTICNKKELYDGDRRLNEWSTSCDMFENDNDLEECLTDMEKACYNCLYRRWTAEGFECAK